MLKFYKGCTLGCGLPCIGSSCPYMNDVELICDECGYETDKFYGLEEDDRKAQLCEDCFMEKMKPIERENEELDDEYFCNECEDVEVPLYEYYGEYLCKRCLLKKAELTDDEIYKEEEEDYGPDEDEEYERWRDTMMEEELYGRKWDE